MCKIATSKCRRLLSFRLRTTLCGIAVVALVFAPIAARIAENRRSAEVVAVFRPAVKLRSCPSEPKFVAYLPSHLSRLLWPRYSECAIEIDETGGRIFGNRDLQGIDALAKLRILAIPNSSVTDEGIGYLLGLSELAQLDLKHSKITDAGLRKLAMIDSLEILDVTGTAITDDGVRYLCSLPKLKMLGLSGTRVTDRAAETLGRIKTLQRVTVAHTSFTSAGGEALRARHPILEIYPVDIAPPARGSRRVWAN